MNIKQLIEKHGDTNENWLILEFLTDKKPIELKINLNFCVDSIYDEFLKIVEETSKILDISISTEIQALEEGGIKAIYKFFCKKKNKRALVGYPDGKAALKRRDNDALPK